VALSPQISDEARRAAAVIANGRFHLVALLSSTHAQLPLKPGCVSTKKSTKNLPKKIPLAAARLHRAAVTRQCNPVIVIVSTELWF